MTLPAAYLGQFSEPAGFANYAATGPVSIRVRQVLEELWAGIGAPVGDIGAAVFPHYEAALGVIAGFMDTPVDRIAPMPATSMGLFHTAFGLLGAGGNVVAPSHEFPANLYPWMRAEEAGGPRLRRVEIPDGRVTPEAIAAAVDAETRAIAISLVDFQTGFRVDLDAMREVAGDALLVVDAIQALGAVYRGIGPADVMVAGGQKWMRAGWGSGVMAVSERGLDRLAPTLSGWLGVEDAMDFDRPAPHPVLQTAGRYQEGTPPIIGAFQFGAAIEVIEMAGIEAVSAAIAERVGQFEDVLRRAGADISTPWTRPEERAGILCFRLPGAEPLATVEHLTAAGLVVSQRGPWIRLSPHASTPHAAVEMLASALGVGA